MPLAQKNRTSTPLIIIFVFLALSLSLGGYILYWHQKENITQEKHNELAAINKLKIEQIANWRNNLLSDAKTIYYDQPVITHIHEFVSGTNLNSNHGIIKKWSESLLKEFEYTKVLLVDPDGKVIMNTSPDEPLLETGKQIIDQAVRNKDIFISDFYWYDNTTILISVAIPLYLEVGNRNIFSGVVLASINPKKFIYPLIQTWPTPSLTGETLIYRRVGDSVLVLNDLRLYQNGALRLIKPMTDTLLPAIRAAMGRRGIIDGVDYRGISILADVDTIADTHWLIVTKVDTDEIFQPIHRQALWVLIITLLLIFVCAFIIYTIWIRNTIKSEQDRLALVKHFDYLVKYANDIIILSDFEGNIYEANDRTVSAYGYTRDEMLKMNITQLRAPETKDMVKRQLDLINENDGIIYEALHVRKNGERFPIETSGRRMEVDGVFYYQFIIRDITERKKTEEALIKAKEKAEESDRLKTAFLNNMSHEIRTPMNGILGFSELLDDETLTREDRNEYVKRINDNSLQLLSIINDIIDISTIQSKQLILNPDTFNLHKLLKELFDTIEQDKLVRGKGDIKLILDEEFEAHQSMIYSDEIRLRQILHNLLSNALKFTKSGIIKFGYTVREQMLLFYVQDTGKGIAKEQQALIFERFRQEEVEYTREFGGTGLGLSISKELVDLLGGQMCMESEEGVGTTIYFTIEFKEGFSDSENIKNIANQDKAVPMTKQLKILTVEDDLNSELLLTVFLRKYCSEHLHAVTGKEAIDICRQNPDLDLILMDIRLPEMNGYMATQEIRKFNNSVVIIAQTAFALSDDQTKAMAAGCTDYISKPIKRADFDEVIKKYFN